MVRSARRCAPLNATKLVVAKSVSPVSYTLLVINAANSNLNNPFTSLTTLPEQRDPRRRNRPPLRPRVREPWAIFKEALVHALVFDATGTKSRSIDVNISKRATIVRGRSLINQILGIGTPQRALRDASSTRTRLPSRFYSRTA